MKYAIVALAFAVAAKAQTPEDIPECAVPCIEEGIATESDCSAGDWVCACANLDAIQGAATGCVLAECGSTVALS